MISKTQLEEALVLAMSNNSSSSHDSPPSTKAAPHVVQKLSDESSSVEEEVATMTTTSVEDPPTISPMDPSPSHSSALRLPQPPHANDDDGGVSLEAWSEWDSIPDNASKSSSSTRTATLSSIKSTGVANSQGKRETKRGAIYEDDGDLPSLSGRRNEPRYANPQHQHRSHNVTTANDPPEYGYRNKAGHRAVTSTGIHNIQMNSRGHVYLDGEESVANSSDGPPGNLARAINNMMSSSNYNNNNRDDDDNESKSTRYSINSKSSTNSPPPPSDYFHQPSHRQMYPAEPRRGAVDSVGSSEATSIASNTTRSTTTTKNSDSRGGVGGNGEYFDGNNGNNSALDRHLSKSGSTGRSNNGNSNSSSRRKQDPQDYTEMIRKQDPQDNATGDYYGNAYSSRHVSRHRDEMEPFVGRQQQRVVYASSAKRDLYNHSRNTYPDKAKDSDLESGRGSSYHQQQQRVRFADKMFSSRENTFSSSASSSHQVVVGNAPSSSSSSAYGLSWRDRSVCSDSSATSKSSIDSQSSNSSMSNRTRGGSSNGSRIGGIGLNVVSMLATGLGNIFEGLQHSTAPVPAPSSNSSTSSNSSSGSGGGGGARNSNSARFNHLKRYTALLATLSLMMLVTIGSYSGAFFGASASDNNDKNSDSPRGLGIEHDMRPPAMGLMDNVPHQDMLKGSVGAGLNTNGGGNIIMGGGGGGGLPPLVENGQVVDWDKVPPHLRGYYSKIFGAEASGNANQQQQQQQQQAEMQYTQQKQVQEENPNAAAQAIQSIGNEAIGAESAFKIPTLEQHEFKQHIEELEGAVPFLGKQQQQEQLQQQEVQQQQQEQQVQQQDDQEAKQELVKQQLEQVHQRQQAEAEQQRVQAEQQQQEQQQRAQVDQQHLKEMSPPSPEESDAAREVNAEEELRRKQAEQEALQKAGIAEEKMNQPQDESEAAAAQNGEANDMNEAIANVDPAEAGGQSNTEDPNATLESLQSEFSELMEKVKQQAS